MPMPNSDHIKVKVWRGDAGGGSFAEFEVPQQPAQTVLDVVTWIQRHACAAPVP
jgi:succinate dehydrogenase/fumarate reductase-like Fe-S protein